MQASAEAGPQEVDPAVAKQRAVEEEERRLAEIRAHGTPVTAGDSPLSVMQGIQLRWLLLVQSAAIEMRTGAILS